MIRWLSIGLLALAACSGGREVKVQVAIPGPDSVDAPVAHLAVVALPYDRDSVLASMEAGHPRPEGVTSRLDSLFQRFQGPFVSYAAEAYRVQSVELALAQLKRALDSLPRQSPPYDSLYRRFAGLSDSLDRLHNRREEARFQLAKARNQLGPEIDSLRARMSRWQDSTYRGYDSLTRRLGSGIGREPVSDSTGADGTLTLRLPPGDWWIYARSWDTWDPNREWYWNVPVKGTLVVLDRASGRQIPRY